MIEIKREKIIDDELVEYIDSYYDWDDVLADDFRSLLESRGHDFEFIEDELIMLPYYIEDTLQDCENLESTKDIKDNSEYKDFFEVFLEYIHYNVDNSL